MAITNFDNYADEGVNLVNRLDSTLTTGAGAGITAGTGTVYNADVVNTGGRITTTILLDLTGLDSVATDLDIIGVSGSSDPAHLGLIADADVGTIFGGYIRCLEVPTGGDPNTALYGADEGTGVEDGGIAALTETLIADPAGDWTLDQRVSFTTAAITAMNAADQYLYMVQGDATGTAATYTAGKFEIVVYSIAD